VVHNWVCFRHFTSAVWFSKSTAEAVTKKCASLYPVALRVVARRCAARVDWSVRTGKRILFCENSRCAFVRMERQRASYGRWLVIFVRAGGNLALDPGAEAPGLAWECPWRDGMGEMIARQSIGFTSEGEAA